MSHRLLTNQPEPVPLADLDDDALLGRMQDDDAAAYQVLVERHVDRAYALALRMLRCVADAEDVAQEAMVRTWTHRQAWRPGQAKFSTWLYRVVVNRCIDVQRRPQGATLEEVPEPIAETADCVATIHRHRVYSQLEVAMGSLPAQQRAALTLAYFDDLGNGEIAEVLGTTVSAVEGLLKRGRQGLRERLRRAEGEMRRSLAED